MNAEQVCYLALGSNIGDSLGFLQRATDVLKAHKWINVRFTSPVYVSKPHGPKNQKDFLNTVIQIVTKLSADDLLQFTQSVEDGLQRDRAVPKWSARNIDIDILLYGNDCIKDEHLMIPHPHMSERAFVLFPLFDVIKLEGAEDLKINENATLLSYMKALPLKEMAIKTSFEVII